MSERHGRDWTRMTPDDFGQEAPRRPDAPTRPDAVPAVPDDCGTAPLFGDERAAARPRDPQGNPEPPCEQPKLF